MKRKYKVISVRSKTDKVNPAHEYILDKVVTLDKAKIHLGEPLYLGPLRTSKVLSCDSDGFNIKIETKNTYYYLQLI